MQTLRQARRLACLALAWFVLALGVAVASPMLKPVDFDSVCSASGAAKLVIKKDAGDAPAGHGLDCPLCLTTGAPPPVALVGTMPPPVLSHAMQPIPAARIAALTAAPLPARGPPGQRRA